MNCLFCKIARGEVAAGIVYESDGVVAFDDIKPQAPVHVVIIPRKHIETVQDVTAESAEAVSGIMTAVPHVAKKKGVHDTGYRLVFNCKGDAGQEVYHIHCHLIGGRRCTWPPG